MQFETSWQWFGVAYHEDIATGDLDGDGDIDAWITKESYADEVWFNNGDGTFVKSGQTTGVLVNAVALGDLDGDGDLDAFVVDSGPGNIVMLNDGLGNFTNSGQLLGNSYSVSVALGDLDGDGDLDAYVGNDSSHANRVWINSGDGTFTDSGQLLGSEHTLDVALGDLDGDDDLDAWAASGGSDNKIWINDGNGVFSDSGQDLSSGGASAVALGDFDGDGDLDAWLPSGAADHVWLNDGNGVFSDSGQALGDERTHSVAIADMDGDGDLDAVTAVFREPNRLWLNDGNGIFSDSGQVLPEGYGSEDVSIQDFDNDGDPDVLFVNDDAGNTILLNSGGGTLVTIYHALGYGGSSSVALGDVDGDGDLDAWATGHVPSQLWLNDGNGSFTNTRQPLGTYGHESVDFGDLDNDGDLDAFVIASADGDMSEIYINDGSGVFTHSGQLLNDTYGKYVKLGDLDGDGDLDAFIANQFDDTVWLNDGNGRFSDSGQRLGGFHNLSTAVDLGDIDGDGDLDAVVTVHGDFCRIWINDGSGAFTGGGSHLTFLAQWVALGDLDADGDLDAFVGTSSRDYVWFNNGSGDFTQSLQDLDDPYNGCMHVVLGDLDNDGDLDAFGTTISTWYQHNTWINNGQGVFSYDQEEVISYRADNVALGDVDGDGDLDAWVGSTLSDRLWLNVTAPNAAPAVSITAPTTGDQHATEESPLTVGGTASDDLSVAGVTWSNSRGGSGTCAGTDDWTADIALFEGTNVITITSTDAEGETGTDILTVDYTSGDPTITISAPTAGDTHAATASPLAIGGTATDDGSIARVFWTNNRGGSGAATGTDTWTASVTLYSGFNYITVMVTDDEGNNGWDYLSVNYTPPDPVPPTVTINYPTDVDTYSTHRSPLTVGGIASDDGSIASVAWTNSLGGSGTCSGTVNWADSITLFPGSNLITITATDGDGLTATDTLTVDYTQEDPRITITTPTDAYSYTTTSSPLTIGGTAVDNGSVVSVAWFNSQGESGAGVGTDNWTASIPLQSGYNYISVMVTDDEGNIGTDILTVEYTPVTQGPPTVAISAPTTGPTYTATASALTIGGTAADDGSVAAVAWSNSLGGGGTCTGTDSWTVGIALYSGTNVITVTATDDEGNTGTDTLTVNYSGGSTNTLVVEITFPTTSDIHTADSSPLTIGGTATGDGTITSVSWFNNLGYSGTCTGTEDWSATIPLQPGFNAITVTAEDDQGNRASDGLIVTMSDVDPGAPVIALTDPVHGGRYQTMTGHVTISGTAEDNVAVSHVSWVNNRGGSGSCTGAEDWSADIELAEGENLIIFTAHDGDGLSSSTTLTVFFGIDNPVLDTFNGESTGGGSGGGCMIATLLFP